MSTFLALYRGQTIGSAQLLAVSADPDIVARFASELLDQEEDADPDPAVEAIRDGRRRALRLVRDQADTLLSDE